MVTGTRGPKTSILLALVVILLAGFFLRTFGLDSSSFWLDEVSSHQRASQAAWGELYQALRDKNQAPLYSAVLLRLWMKIGDGEFFLRFLTAAIGTLNIGVVFLVGRETLKARAGLISAFLLATSTMHIYYSKVIRMYVPTALFTSLVMHFLFRATKSGKWQNWLGYVLTAALALYTHYYSAFSLISLSVFILAGAWVRKNRELSKSLLVSDGAIALLFLPWLPTFGVQFGSNPVSWISPITWQSFHTTFARFFINKAILGQSYPVFACALVLTMTIGMMAMMRSRKEDPQTWWNYLLLVSGFLGPILIALAVSLLKPFVVDRYFVMTIVPASVVLSQGIIRLSQRRWGLLLSIALLSGILICAYGTGTTQWREDWRKAADYVRANAKPGDVLVLGSDLHQGPLNYYYNGSLPQYSLPDNPMCEDEAPCRTEVRQAIDDLHPKRLWMVRTERFHGDHGLEGYLGSSYLGPRISCREFGGFWEAEICLHEVRMPE